MNKLFSAHTGKVLIALQILITAGAHAEEITTPKTCEQKLTLNEFRAYALNNSPLVAEIDRDYAKELASAFETKSLQNPELQLERTFTKMDIQGANDAQAQISLGQPVRLSNFGKRSDVAWLITRSGDIQKRAQLLELTQKLSVQYKTIRALEETQTLLQESEKRATKKVISIRDGVTKGLLSQGDEKLFEGEKYRLQAQVKNIESAIANMRRDLSQSIAHPCIIHTSETEQADIIPALEVLIQKATTSEIGESARVDLLNNLTQEQVRLAELDSFPQITPRFLYQHTNDGGDFYGAGISLQLPLWSQNQAEKIRTHAEAKIAHVRATFLKNGGLTNQIINLRAAAISSHEQAEIFSTKVIPAFKGALESQEKLYLEGKGNVLQVWQTMRAFNEVQTQGLQLWLQAALSRAELSVLVGEEI